MEKHGIIMLAAHLLHGQATGVRWPFTALNVKDSMQQVIDYIGSV